MKKYITKFSTTSEYEAAGAGLDYPNVSLITSDKSIKYVKMKPIPNNVILYEANQQLTLVSNTSNQVNAFNMNSCWPRYFTHGSVPCAITNHTFENGIGKIEFDLDIDYLSTPLFIGCTNLHSITLPRSVRLISNNQITKDCNNNIKLNIYADITQYRFQNEQQIFSEIHVPKIYKDKIIDKYKIVDTNIPQEITNDPLTLTITTSGKLYSQMNNGTDIEGTNLDSIPNYEIKFVKNGIEYIAHRKDRSKFICDVNVGDIITVYGETDGNNYSFASSNYNYNVKLWYSKFFYLNPGAADISGHIQSIYGDKVPEYYEDGTTSRRTEDGNTVSPNLFPSNFTITTNYKNNKVEIPTQEYCIFDITKIIYDL